MTFLAKHLNMPDWRLVLLHLCMWHAATSAEPNNAGLDLHDPKNAAQNMRRFNMGCSIAITPTPT